MVDMAFVEPTSAELTTTMAAERLGVSSGTIRQAISSRHLQARRTPWGTWTIDPNDFERWVATRDKAPRHQDRRNRQELPASALRVLGALVHFEEASPTEISDVIGLHAGNVRKHLCLMARHGIAYRTPLGSWRPLDRGRELVARLEADGIDLNPEEQLSLRIVPDVSASRKDTTI